MAERYDRQYQQRQDVQALEVAIALYTAAINADPSYAKAWNNRGVLRLRQGDAAAASANHETAGDAYQAARDDLQRAADLNTAYAYNLGMAWGQYAAHLMTTRGRIPGVRAAIEKANEAFARVPAAKGTERGAKVEMARASIDALAPERTELYPKRLRPPADIAGPDAAALHYLAARTWARLGDREDASRALEAAMALQPDLESLAMNDPDLRPHMVELNEKRMQGGSIPAG